MTRPFLLPLALLVLAACDAAAPDDTGPAELPPLSADAQARVVETFAEAERLFAYGTRASRKAGTGTHGIGTHGAGEDDAPLPRLAHLSEAEARALVADTTRFTGLYDSANDRGFLATLAYRKPLGADLWQVTLQAGREVTPATESDPGTFAVETFAASFYSYADLQAFVQGVEAGTNPYLAGTSQDAREAFGALDVWRLAQLYSPAAGEAVVTYTTDELRESYSLRDPVVTLNRDGTCTVRAGGSAGAVETRYYESDCAAALDGSVTGTLNRTLTTSGDATGAVTSRTDFATGAWTLVTQRGGDGVVIRQTSEG